MNLKQFLDYRTHCPLCTSELNLYFHSQKWQNISLEEDRLNIMFRLTSLKMCETNYKVIYSFGLYDNTWYADFMKTVGDQQLEECVPHNLLTRFKELDKNLREYHFYKVCDCNKYSYSSTSFMLKYDGTLLNELDISLEYIGLSTKADNGYKIYKVYNWVHLNESSVFTSKQNSEEWASRNFHLNTNPLILPKLVNFTSEEEMLSKIGKYLLFS